jgi:hypothetical protein
MAAPPYLIVWDLDRTLGVFEALERVRDTAVRVEIELRPGMGRALERLADAGFAHTVLSLATPDYAELALRGAGLRSHFLEVACQGHRFKGDAAGIAQSHGIPEAERGARMLFVGDHVLYDAPQDARVLLHLEPRALRRPADRLVELVLGLRERGHGSLRAGFDELLGAGAAPDEIAPRDLHGAGRLLLLPRERACPVVAFEDDEQADTASAERVSFVPAEAYPELAEKLGQA